MFNEKKVTFGQNNGSEDWLDWVVWLDGEQGFPLLSGRAGHHQFFYNPEKITEKGNIITTVSTLRSGHLLKYDFYNVWKYEKWLREVDVVFCLH